MERGARKRQRAEDREQGGRSSRACRGAVAERSGKEQQQQQQAVGPELDEVELFKRVFEFPWKGGAVAVGEPDGCDFRDVFFSSLVDGSSAKIGLPGDRLASCHAAFQLGDGSWPSAAEVGDEAESYDCIWSALLPPPPLVAGKGPTT